MTTEQVMTWLSLVVTRSSSSYEGCYWLRPISHQTVLADDEERIQHCVQGLLWQQRVDMGSINVGGKRCGNKTHDVKDIGFVCKEVEEQLETVRQDNRMLAEVFKTAYTICSGSKGSTMGIITVGDNGYINGC